VVQSSLRPEMKIIVKRIESARLQGSDSQTNCCSRKDLIND